MLNGILFLDFSQIPERLNNIFDNLSKSCVSHCKAESSLSLDDWHGDCMHGTHSSMVVVAVQVERKVRLGDCSGGGGGMSGKGQFGEVWH